jgi:ribosomal protein S19
MSKESIVPTLAAELTIVPPMVGKTFHAANSPMYIPLAAGGALRGVRVRRYIG